MARKKILVASIERLTHAGIVGFASVEATGNAIYSIAAVPAVQAGAGQLGHSVRHFDL